MIERPLDFLSYLKQRDICITIKDGKEIIGKLIAFDIHINLVIEVKGGLHRFIRGDMVQWINETNTDIKVTTKGGKR